MDATKVFDDLTWANVVIEQDELKAIREFSIKELKQKKHTESFIGVVYLGSNRVFFLHSCKIFFKKSHWLIHSNPFFISVKAQNGAYM